MGKLFGTDGIRGVANKDPMTAEMAMKIGQAVVCALKRKGHRQRVVIGKDTRLSGYMLENALTAGITSMGADVILVGPMPTPGIAFITSNMDADCGIVISASHNPFEDNGIKVFSKDGFKLSDEQELKIEKLIFSNKLSSLVSSPREIGHVYREEDARGRYIVFLRHTFPRDLSLEGVKIVLDCANGATYKVAPTLFREMRAEVIPLNVSPDGKNINLKCGALHPERLADKVTKSRADVGLAFDGDGDRLITSDEKGNIVDGDKLLAICAKSMKKEGRLKKNSVVSTVMSNLGLAIALKGMGIKHVKSKVGDRYVLEEMLKGGAVLGGEESGHTIFLEHHTTGDGIISALQLLAVMQREGKPLSELAKVMKTLPQVVTNVDVKSKPELKGIPEITNAIKEAEKELGDKGRVLVRYSGTQPMCRVMVEGPTKEKTEKLTKKIAGVVKDKLG
ncbi:MAG: phosphoglucosamine mutase [Deltaproteobacteria bacterium]|nr:MAG: phosphoglucosamine mutase [Deltaproteobacteria bacterium]